MSVSKFVSAILPILDSNVVGAAASSLLGAGLGLWTYRRQAKERLAAAVSWSSTMTHAGPDEMPFLVVQNMGNIPSYITSARYLRGNVIRRLQKRLQAIVTEDPEDDNYPKIIPAASAGHFMILQSHVQQMAENARWYNQVLHRLGRHYVWIEFRTIAGRRLVVSAREAICPRDRPDWW